MALSRRPWTTLEARQLVGDDATSAITAAKASIAQDLAPVPRDAEALTGWKRAMDERLRRLAVKISPGMSVEQGKPWRDVMVDALSDLPAMVALTAAKRAIHRPMKFLNEVEAIVREIAQTVMLERKVARMRLDELLAEMKRANRPALPPQADGAPFSPDEIRKMSAAMRAFGVGVGAISQTDVDAATPPSDLPETPIAPVPRVSAGPKPEATVADYIALGLSPDDAEAAMAERRRLLARRPETPIAAAAANVAAEILCPPPLQA